MAVVGAGELEKTNPYIDGLCMDTCDGGYTSFIRFGGFEVLEWYGNFSGGEQNSDEFRGRDPAINHMVFTGVGMPEFFPACYPGLPATNATSRCTFDVVQIVLHANTGDWAKEGAEAASRWGLRRPAK